MKISEIVGSVVVQPPEEPSASTFTRRIANAFTRGGRVKRPLDFQTFGSQSISALDPSLSIASDKGTSVDQSPDAVRSADPTYPTLPVADLDVEPRFAVAHSCASYQR